MFRRRVLKKNVSSSNNAELNVLILFKPTHIYPSSTQVRINSTLFQCLVQMYCNLICFKILQNIQIKLFRLNIWILKICNSSVFSSTFSFHFFFIFSILCTTIAKLSFHKKYSLFFFTFNSCPKYVLCKITWLNF